MQTGAICIGWERDPFGGPLENFDKMRSRARNERRVAQGGRRRLTKQPCEAAREEPDRHNHLTSGSWQSAPGGRRQIEEHWTQVAGASMLGMSRTVAGEKTVEFEYLRIEQRADGIYYVAHPEARCPATDFKLARASATEAVFENPQHDFPSGLLTAKVQTIR